MSRWLTPEEVYRLTGKRRHKAQITALTARRIRWTKGGKGEPLVVPEDAHDGSAAVDAGRGKARNTGPRWNRIHL